MEEFQLNTKIVSGPGAIGVLGQEKARRVFLVTDPFFVKNGMADRVVRAAGAESCILWPSSAQLLLWPPAALP